MNNLQIFRNEVQKLTTDNNIADKQQWNQLMERLCDQKLLSPKQAKILQQNSEKRNYPISIVELQEIIMKQFGSEQNKALLHDLLTIQKQIRQTKGVLTIWKDKGMSAAQIKQLRVMFAKGNHKIKQICKTLENKKQLMQAICEQEIQLIKAMDQWITMQKIVRVYQNYQEFQDINQKTIQNVYHANRVREVHFRTKKTKNKNYGIFQEIGFNSQNDQPLEVTKIYKKYTNFDHMNQVLMTFNAHKDLILSPYFLRYRGYNNMLDPEYFMYFREYAQSLNLHHIVYETKCELDENVALFKFWAGEMFRALRDIFVMCSYIPVFPIKLADFCVSDHGLRVILKNIHFEGPRELSDDSLEPKLRQNLGLLMLQLLKITPDEINQKIQSIQNISLINCLLKASDSYQRYKDKIVPCYINFFNAQTHPLFESIQQTQGIQIMNNFTALYGDYV